MKLAAALLLAGCVDPPCYSNGYANVTNYAVNTSISTPEGIHVDSSGFVVDLSRIDYLTNRVEACVKTKANQSPPAEGHCLGGAYRTEVHRECMKVKIAPDWYVGCLGEQVFPCTIDPAACEAKGLHPTAECPCECRSTIQENDTVVTTPDLYMYTGELLRLVSGCNNIWVTELATCYE